MDASAGWLSVIIADHPTIYDLWQRGPLTQMDNQQQAVWNTKVYASRVRLNWYYLETHGIKGSVFLTHYNLYFWMNIIFESVYNEENQ